MYLFFDTETTGLPRDWNAPIKDLSNWPRIVQIAWVEYDKKRNLISQGDYIINPEGFTIPQDVSRIHKIFHDDAVEKGYPLKKVLNVFNAIIDKNDYIIAHNVNFDDKVLSAEFLREYITSTLPEKKKVCTMESTVDFLKIPNARGGYKYPSLADLSRKLFGEAFKDAHNALVDIQNTAKIFWELIDRNVIDLENLNYQSKNIQESTNETNGLTLF
jgi:DNA polymerase III epsilon subunit-like protein